MSLSHLAFVLSNSLCFLCVFVFPASQLVFYGGLVSNASDRFLWRALTISHLALGVFLFTLFAKSLLQS